ncbi:MAG: hypothetical protein ACO1SX_27960 [Actinomycetota bacterium]
MPTALRLPADNPVSLYPSEEPQYPALSRVVATAWRETRRSFGRLSARIFEIVNLTDPTKDDDDAAAPLTSTQRHAINRAVEVFLREFAGADRSAAGFASGDTEDGILQQIEFLAHEVGVGRARQLVPGAPNPALTASQRRRILENAFERLSTEGRLRFEDRLLEIRDDLVRMFNAGENPLVIARELGTDLGSYEQYRLRMLVRTEAAYASEGAITGMLQAAGVQYVEVLGDPTTDETCTQWFGRKLLITDTNSQPPFHPHCYCSRVVWTEPETRSWNAPSQALTSPSAVRTAGSRRWSKQAPKPPVATVGRRWPSGHPRR